jgi:hypothetical protein
LYGVANTLLIRAANHNHLATDALAGRLEDTLAGAGHPSLSQLIYAGLANNKAQNRAMVLIVQGIGLLIVAISMLGLLNAITMSIIERTPESVHRGQYSRDASRLPRSPDRHLTVVLDVDCWHSAS